MLRCSYPFSACFILAFGADVIAETLRWNASRLQMEKNEKTLQLGSGILFLFSVSDGHFHCIAQVVLKLGIPLH